MNEYTFDMDFNSKTPKDLTVLSDKKLIELKNYYDSMSWSRWNEPDPKTQSLFLDNQARINKELRQRVQNKSRK